MNVQLAAARSMIKPPDLTLTINEGIQQPDFPSDRAVYEQFYSTQAADLLQALCYALPVGTLDQLLTQLLKLRRRETTHHPLQGSLGYRPDGLIRCAQGMLLLYRPGLWDEAKQKEWVDLMGPVPMSTAVLMECVEEELGLVGLTYGS